MSPSRTTKKQCAGTVFLYVVRPPGIFPYGNCLGCMIVSSFGRNNRQPFRSLTHSLPTEAV